MKSKAFPALILVIVTGSLYLSFFYSTGSEYDSVVIFRNDDLSSVDEDLREFNSVFQNKDIPLTHSVVPKSVIESENYNSTCTNLRSMEQKGISFAIHGYNHNGSEFKNADWTEIESKLSMIDSFSQECLGHRPDVFVAPHNSMSAEARILINESGYEVISADRKMAWQTADSKIIGNRTEFLQKRPLELGQSSMMVDRWDAKPIEFRNISYLENRFDKSQNNNEIYVQTLHSGPIMRNNQSSQLEALITHMESENVYFSSFEELTSLFEEDKINFNGKKWVIRK